MDNNFNRNNRYYYFISYVSFSWQLPFVWFERIVGRY